MNLQERLRYEYFELFRAYRLEVFRYNGRNIPKKWCKKKRNERVKKMVRIIPSPERCMKTKEIIDAGTKIYP